MVHIFNQPISNEPIKSCGIKTEYICQELFTDRSIYLNVLHMIGRSKMNYSKGTGLLMLFYISFTVGSSIMSTTRILK